VRYKQQKKEACGRRDNRKTKRIEIMVGPCEKGSNEYIVAGTILNDFDTMGRRGVPLKDSWVSADDFAGLAWRNRCQIRQNLGEEPRLCT